VSRPNREPATRVPAEAGRGRATLRHSGGPVPIVINLDPAIERRERMASQLRALGLRFERLGHDFRRLDRTAIRNWYAAHFPSLRPPAFALSGAELGCWASHLSAWAHIAASGRSAGTVLEDDVLLAPEIGTIVRTLESDLGGFDVVYLGTSSRNLSRRRVAAVAGLRLHRPVGLVVNTWGYVVSARWAAALLAAEALPITMPVDHFLGGRARLLKPRIAVLRPACVHEDPLTAAASQIQPHTWRPDRFRAVEGARRRFLESRASRWVDRLFRWL
jgi:glycosyl transferase family 25